LRRLEVRNPQEISLRNNYTTGGTVQKGIARKVPTEVDMRYKFEPPVSTQVGLDKERGGKIFMEKKYCLHKKKTIS
jgi:hypothetical protein